MKYLSLIIMICLLGSAAHAAPSKKKGARQGISMFMKRSNNIYSLHEAAATGNEDILKKRLSEPSININQQDEFGNTPLHVAADAGNKNIVKLLLKAGASKNVLNKENKTAEQCAAASVRAMF